MYYICTMFENPGRAFAPRCRRPWICLTKIATYRAEKRQHDKEIYTNQRKFNTFDMIIVFALGNTKLLATTEKGWPFIL